MASTVTGEFVSDEAETTTSASARALLDAARQLFSTTGYEKTSVSDITKRAGTSVGTLYYHFSGKADVFLALYTEHVRRQEDRVRSAIDALRGAGISDHRLQYIAGTRAYLLGAWESRELSRIFSDPQAPGAYHDAGKEVGDAWSRRNLRFLTEGDITPESRAMVSGLSGAMGVWAMDLSTMESEVEARAYIDGAVHRLVAPALGVTLTPVASSDEVV